MSPRSGESSAERFTPPKETVNFITETRENPKVMSGRLGFDFVENENKEWFVVEFNGNHSGFQGAEHIEGKKIEERLSLRLPNNPSWLERIANDKSVQSKYIPEKNRPPKIIGKNENILIVDTIGLLSRIYYYASVAYIGGGLNEGIHNCLEPVVYFKPVLFYGNDYHKYNEAVDLIALGAAKNILSAETLAAELSYYLSNTTESLKIENRLKNYFKTQSGTTKKVLEILNLNE